MKLSLNIFRASRQALSLTVRLARWLTVLALLLSYLGATPQTASAATINVVASISVDTTWTTGNVYVINIPQFKVNSGVTLTIEPDVIVKFGTGRYLDVFGTLDMQGTAGNEIIFTSLRDDSVGGDTNGDSTSTEPAAGDWDAIYLENGLTTFEYAIVKYSTRGLNVYNVTAATISPEIANNTFADNVNGVSLTMTNTGNIGSHIHDNSFTHNANGLAVNVTGAATGTATPTVSDNDFNNHTGFPIYLGATAYPTYSGNTFTTNAHAAIALGGPFRTSGTWTVVNNMPFVVSEHTTIHASAVVTVPVGAVIKFQRGRYLDIFGELELQSTAVTSPTVFTSFWDDTYAGDTNGDGECPSCTLEPLPGDWDAVYIENDLTEFEYAVVRYATRGLSVYHTGTGNIAPPIRHNEFDSNHNGLSFVSTSSGQITSEVTDNIFTNTEDGFPIALDGTAYPVYSGNTFSNSLHPAIGVQGRFHHSGSWPLINSMPYVATGHVTLTATKTLSLPVGTVVKFKPGFYLAIDGVLNLQSTGATAPIVFTSYKDDSYAGDTNADGSASQPARSDWGAVYLQGDGTQFDFARVQYSDKGVSVYNSTGVAIAPAITSTVLTENNYGVYLYANTGDIGSLIRSNTFISNTYGLGTATSGPGGSTSYPALQSNSFSNHSGFPIYLGGSAFPTYSANTFSANTHPAIALGGWFNDSGTWTRVNSMPYVVVANTSITKSVMVTLPVNLVLKFDSGRYLDVFGGISLASTNATAPLVFTSYKDDSHAGDTNADGGATVPARGDWDAVYLHDSSTFFDYALVKYGAHGVSVYAGCGCTALSPTIEHSTFTENVYGVYLYAGHNFIFSEINNNSFSFNTYGLGTATDGEIGYTSFPELEDNSFSNHSGFPIYLGGSAFPTYSGNTFSANTHPAIALGGWFNDSGTWPIINSMPYVVKDDVSINIGVTVTVPAGEVLKFDLDRYLHAYGTLDLQSTGATPPIVLTSYRDDTHAGDTNADGGATGPAAADWKTVWLYTSASDFEHALVKYATTGVSVYYDGPSSTNIFPHIANNTLTQNLVGALLAIGYDDEVPGSGAGNITSLIEDNVFDANGYGLATYAHPNSTGIAQPTLTNNSFTNHSGFPIYLGGTAYPIYTGNLALGQASAQAANSLAAGPALPAESLALGVSRVISVVGDPAASGPQPGLAEAPAVGNLFANNTHAAIALGGSFNGTGTWSRVDDMPYVVVGAYPILVNDLLPSADVRVGVSATVSLPPGTVVKLSSGRYVDVFGGLNPLGSAGNPVVFTSYKDDALGGDSNADGAASVPARGDWRAVYLESSATVFDHAVVKYATEGVQVYYSGGPNTNIFPEVADSVFVENLVALSFHAHNHGDITSFVHDNVFLNNNTHIQGTTGSGSGKLLMTVTNNDLYGSQAGPFGMNILSANAAITGTLNWWGACSGPYNAALNAGGQGSPVSSHVDFDPWLCAASQGVTTYSVLGQVLDNNSSDPEPIAGVTIRLSNGVTTTTGVDGFYTFDDLPIGTYTVTATLSGYSFFPPLRWVTLPVDATEVNFVGTLGSDPSLFGVFLPLVRR